MSKVRERISPLFKVFLPAKMHMHKEHFMLTSNKYKMSVYGDKIKMATISEGQVAKYIMNTNLILKLIKL